MQIQLSEIRTDGGTQPRAQLDGVTVSEYAEAMERGTDFPPVKLMHDGDNYWLYDGFHRVKAAQQIGRKQIEAEVQQGTREEAVWESLAANKKHGLRRSKPDRDRAIRRALEGWGNEKSQREIARHIGVGKSTVSRINKEVSQRDTSSQKHQRGKGGRVQGADGKWYPAQRKTSDTGGNRPKPEKLKPKPKPENPATPDKPDHAARSKPTPEREQEPDPMTTGAPSRRRRQSLRSRNSKMDALDLDDKEEPPTSEEVSQEIIRAIAKIRDSDGVQALRDFVDGQHQFTKEEKMRVKDAAQSLIDDLRNIHTQIK